MCALASAAPGREQGVLTMGYAELIEKLETLPDEKRTEVADCTAFAQAAPPLDPRERR